MMSDPSEDSKTIAHRTCPKCTEALVDSGNFCSHCGTRIVDDGVAIDRYVVELIESKLDGRLKDQTSVVREVAIKAEEVIISRFRNYGILIAAFIAVIGFFGYKSLADVLVKFQPLLESTENKIKVVSANTQTAETKIAVVRKSLDTLSSSAAAQADRLNLRNGEIIQKLEQLDINRKKLEQLSLSYEEKLKTVSDKIGKIENDLNGRVQQVVEQATDLQISQVYPSLGQKAFLTLNGRPWKGAADKKSADTWIDIAVGNWAMADYTQDDIRALAKRLELEGYRTFIGYAGTGGATGLQDILVSRPQASTVYYFDDAKRFLAENIAAIVGEIVHLQFLVQKSPDSKSLGLGSPISEQQDFILKNSGLDFEIVLALKPRK